MNPPDADPAPFACDMSALTPPERVQHNRAAQTLFGALQAVREEPDGYAFRFAADPERVAQAAAFIALERRCCPFFGFVLELEPHGTALWLRLRGREGVKPFIRAELGPFVAATGASF